MGAVTDALARGGPRRGAEMRHLRRGQRDPRHRRRRRGHLARRHARRTPSQARRVLANVAPWVLRILLGGDAGRRTTKPEGAQLKINLLLDRLPPLKSGVDPAVAFAGTLHLAEDYSQLEAAYADAAGGRGARGAAGRGLLPLADRPLDPGRSPRRHAHAHLLRAAHAGVAVRADPAARRTEAVRRALAALDEHLAEPIESCLATDADGNPCIEAKIPQDVEADLAMPGGHIFHGDLDWPWAPNRGPAGHPRPAVGRGRPTSTACCCAARAPAAAARSPASAATTPRRRCWPRGRPRSGHGVLPPRDGIIDR